MPAVGYLWVHLKAMDVNDKDVLLKTINKREESWNTNSPRGSSIQTQCIIK